jgi:CRISPR-associated helicase Cas3/CRISPR-associated endonuclease Cas3-HD
MPYYAHTKEDPETKNILPKEYWQLLKDHLKAVESLARERAAKFGAEELGSILGLAHDLGKYSLEFQNRLEGIYGKVDHSTAGAKEIYKLNKNVIGKAMAYIISGHHGGLPDGNPGNPSNLPERLSKTDIPDYMAYKNEICIPDLSKFNPAGMPRAASKDMEAFSFSFCIRMLFSCLVDADYLDTERFMDPERFLSRASPPLIQNLFIKFESKLAELAEKCRQNPSSLNLARRSILNRCLEMADSAPGFFTLTVPTGGGKTYSSLAFGLKHAVRYEKDRIIYVAPYTSILEQNAQVFRDALGNDAVLEHHSNFEYPEVSFEEWSAAEKAHRLASENWDRPVVVTTAVQFFESLYANKGSRCRKLHNMSRSVIILDEAQMMPLEFLKPCLWALAELVINYGSTVVFCTATQPAVKDLIPGGLRVTEIMEDPVRLQKDFKRVKVHYKETMSDSEIADSMAEHARILTVVNTRRHARILYDKLNERTQEGVYHLSARMCPAHRKEILADIKKALHDGLPCRTISTQLIEAGVDVDFPVVFRALAGIDSIAQSAGRCNRENRQAIGNVFVFEPEPHGMPRAFSAVAGLTRSTARRLHRFENDFLSLGAIEDYFIQLLDLERDNLDSNGILKMLRDGKPDLAFPYSTIANKFQLIDSPTSSIVVPWDSKAEKIMLEAEHSRFPSGYARSLQPYTIQIYSHELASFRKENAIKTVDDSMIFLTDMNYYDKCFGLKEAKEVRVSKEILIL